MAASKSVAPRATTKGKRTSSSTSAPRDSQQQTRRPVPINPAVAGLNNEAERSLLGATVLAWEALDAAADALTPEDFYEPRHQLLFEAICETPRHEDGTIDLVLLDEQLKQSGHLREVGQAYLHGLVNTCPDAYKYAGYLRIVLECSLERQKQAIGAQLTMGDLSPQDCIGRLKALEDRRLRVLEGAVRTLTTVASSVTPEPIRWLWKRRLARGKLAIMDGDPKLGKGFITMDLAARKSTGRPFPGDSERQEPSAVILISPEDDIADTLVPRLIAAQADLSRIHIMNTIIETDPETGAEHERTVAIPHDIPAIEAAVAQTGAELLIIDPIMGCLDAGVKTAVDNEVRAALMPLKHLATRTSLSVILVRHLNKSGGDKALYRGGGSIGFSALCRTGFLVAEHPDNPAKRVFLPNGNNLSKDAPGLAFALASLDDDAIPWVSWDDEPTDIHPNDVFGTKRSNEQRETLEVLKSGLVTLPAKPVDVALALGVARDDEAGQLRIRQRLRRMAQAGVIKKDAYGSYML